MTPLEATMPITEDLRKIGYVNLMPATTREVLTAWVAGKRGKDLPHSGLGRMVERRLARMRASGEVE